MEYGSALWTLVALDKATRPLTGSGDVLPRICRLTLMGLLATLYTYYKKADEAVDDVKIDNAVDRRVDQLQTPDRELVTRPLCDFLRQAGGLPAEAVGMWVWWRTAAGYFRLRQLTAVDGKICKCISPVEEKLTRERFSMQELFFIDCPCNRSLGRLKCLPPQIEGRWPDKCTYRGSDMRAIFLDVDGVLHPYHDRPNGELEDCKLDLVAAIAHTFDAVVVLSSSWRFHASAYARVRRALGARRVSLAGQTMRLDPLGLDCCGVLRPLEILSWVEKYRPTAWVAIDDLDMTSPELQSPMIIDRLSDHFIQTDEDFGISMEDTRTAFRLFSTQLGLAQHMDLTDDEIVDIICTFPETTPACFVS